MRLEIPLSARHIYILIFYNLIPPAVSRYVARLSPDFRNIFFSDIRVAQAAVRGGHVSCENTANNYSDCISFFTKMQMDHMIEDLEDPVIELL